MTQGGDHLPPSARRYLCDTLGIPVVSLYGSREAPQIGFQCERQDHLHLNVDLYPVRIVDADGAGVGDGERGDVVVSNLVDRATVLLNYRLGDVAATRPGSCACGRSLPLLSLLEGRLHDWLVVPGAGACTRSASSRRSSASPAFRSCRSPRTARRSCVPPSWPGGTASTASAGASARMARLLGDATAVEVHFVDALPRDPSGKPRTVVSHVTRST